MFHVFMYIVNIFALAASQKVAWCAIYGFALTGSYFQTGYWWVSNPDQEINQQPTCSLAGPIFHHMWWGNTKKEARLLWEKWAAVASRKTSSFAKLLFHQNYPHHHLSIELRAGLISHEGKCGNYYQFSDDNAHLTRTLRTKGFMGRMRLLPFVDLRDAGHSPGLRGLRR